MPRLSAVTSLVVLVLGCGPQRYATRTHFAEAASAWVREEGSIVPAPVLVGDARVFGLGEASHGARDVFLARAAITQELIAAGWARALVLESDTWDVCALDAYVHGRTHDVRVALGQVMGLYQHPDSEAFFRWLRAYNANVAEPVRVYGMDAQWGAACRSVDAIGCPERTRRCAQAQALQRAPVLGEGYFGRDELMAANVLEISDAVGSGVIVWAHSGHVARGAPLLFNGMRRSTAPMGWFLARELGAAYHAMSVTFRRGVVSVSPVRGGLLRPWLEALEDVQLSDAPAMTLEGLVTGTRPVLVRVRDLPPLTEATAWFASPQFTRSVDSADRLALLRRGSFAHGWDKYVLREAFDSLLVLPVTRAITNW